MLKDPPEPETPPEGPPDAELVARSQRGDVAAYEELVRRYQGRIYGLIYHMTSHKEDTEDLVSAESQSAQDPDEFRTPIPRMKD